MGFPEIVDFARNFAVMIRIQGPDPKGLKMQKHAFHHYNSGKTTLSASGILFPGAKQLDSAEKGPSLRDSMLVLTVASVIEPFLSQQQRKNISKDKPKMIHGVQIDVLVEEVKAGRNNGESSSWLPAEILTIVDIPMSSTAIKSLIEASPGSVDHGWEVGWSLASFSSGTQSLIDSAQLQVEKSPFQNPEQEMGLGLSKSTPRLVLLRVASKHFQN